MDITPRLHPENSAHGHAQDSRAGSATGPSTSGHRPRPKPSPSPGAGAVPRAGYYAPSSSHTTAKRPASPSPGPGPASDPGTDTTTTPTNTSAAANNINPDPEQDAPRPPRACEACRSLKVRCEPDTQDPRGTCKRCVRTGRECVVTAPTRKRQKKTDSRVAELERKIDALTASLGRGSASASASAGAGAARGDGLGNGAGAPAPAPAPASTGGTGRRWLGGKPVVTAPMSLDGMGTGAGSATGSPEMTGMKRNFNGEVKNRELGPGPGFDAGLNGSTLSSTRPTTPSRWRVNWSSSEPEPTSGFVDVIDKGIVTLEVATEAFNVYIDQMAPQLPIVVFSPGTQMVDIRRSKPILFHSILAISISTVQSDVQALLMEDFYKIIAERVVVKGEKSLELVQAVLISSTWYMPPDHFEELKFYQLIHMAVTLAMDIGLCRRTMTANKHFSVKDLMGKKAFALDLDSPETRRAWMGCYYLSVQYVFAPYLVLITCVRFAKSSRVSAALRRVPMVRWHSYMDECIEILETSPESLPSDKALVRWVKLAQITEEVGFHFSSDEPDSNATFSDPTIQYTLRAFEKQLEQWRRDTPAEHYSLIMRQTDYLLNTYIHEPTMHIDSTTTDQKPDNGHQEQLPPPPPTSPAYINALTNCLTCVHRSLDIILSMDTRSLLLLPTYVLGRASYAMVALMRLYAIVTAPEAQLSQVIDPATLNVDHYLGRVVEHYKAAGEHPGGRTPAKFSVVLGLIRNWFAKQNNQSHPILREALGSGLGRCGHPRDVLVDASKTHSMEGNGSNSLNHDVNRLKMGPSPTTPLHLLSEVAMGEGEPRSQSGSGSESNPNSNIASFPHQHQHPTSIGSLVSQPLPSNQQQQQPWLNRYPSPTPPRYPHPHQHASTYQTPASTGTAGYADPIATATTTAINTNTAANQFFMPETSLPVGMGFEPENLFTLGDMFGDGFFNFPFATAEGQW